MERDSMSQMAPFRHFALLTLNLSWLTQPNMYARGILFGNMKYELGDHSVVRCPELGLTADIDFKTKGWVSGTYNAIGGTIKDDKTGQTLFEISGLWSEEMFIKDLRVSLFWHMFLAITHNSMYTNYMVERQKGNVL